MALEDDSATPKGHGARVALKPNGDPYTRAISKKKILFYFLKKLNIILLFFNK
jgi:hypothetical protein